MRLDNEEALGHWGLLHHEGGGCIYIEHVINTGREVVFGNGFETKFGDDTKRNCENRPPRSKKVLATNNYETKPLIRNYTMRELQRTVASSPRVMKSAKPRVMQSATPHFANCIRRATEGFAKAAICVAAVRLQNTKRKLHAATKYSIGRNSSVGTATPYGVGGPGIESRWGVEIFPTRPDLPCGPPSLLYNRHRVFPGGKAAEAWR